MKNYVSNKDESVRMFRSNFLELFSRVHFLTPAVLFVPVIGYLTYQTFARYQWGPLPALGLLLAGVVFWTLTEYVLHRFVFHYQPTSAWGQRLHFLFHGVHHDYPNDSWRLVMPPIVSIPLATAFFWLFWLTLGEAATAPFFVGFIGGYVFYDIGHYAIHHFPLKGKFWGVVKLHHMKHHYQQPHRGFGVSSPLWDTVWRTTFRK